MHQHRQSAFWDCAAQAADQLAACVFAMLAGFLVAGLLCSQDLRIEASGAVEAVQWSEPIAVPASVATWPEETTATAMGDHRIARVVLHRRDAELTWWRVRMLVGGHERVDLKVTGDKGEPRPFALHPWVSDDVMQLVVRATAQSDGVACVAERIVSMRTTSTSAAHRRLEAELWDPASGLHHRVVADLLSGAPVVAVAGRVVWSDPRDPRWLRPCDSLRLDSGERLELDPGGWAGEPQRTVDGWSVALTRGHPLYDGAGAIWSGRLCCGGSAADLSDADYSAAIAERDAAASGPVLGVWLGWQASGIGLGAARRQPARSVGLDIIEREEAAWLARAVPVDRPWYARDGYANAAYTGQAGDQPDFGFGLEVPRLPLLLRLACGAIAAEGWRAQLSHYRRDGSPLEPTDPECFGYVTGNEVCHHNANVSPNTLGKDRRIWTPNPARRGPDPMVGYDDQHQSANVHALVALAMDWEPARWICEDRIRAMEESVWVRQLGPDSARADGRCALAAAQWAAVVPAMRARAARLIDLRIRSATRWIIGGPVLTTATNRPDARKPGWAAGLPWVSAWEEAIRVSGFAVAMPWGTDPAAYRDGWQRLAVSLSTWAAWQDAAGWALVQDAAWLGGALPEDHSAGMMSWRRDPGNTAAWTFAGFLPAAAMLPADSIAGQRAREVVRWFARSDSADRVTARWWVCAQPIAKLTH